MIAARSEDTGLPPAPRAPVAGGAPLFGAYAGAVDEVGWDGLAGAHARGRLWRALHAKRWHYAGIFGPRVVAALAIVDVGYAANAFAYVFDRGARRLRAELSAMGLPSLSANVAERPGEGALSTFARGNTFLRIERAGARWEVVARAAGDFLIEATLDAAAAPPTLCAIAAIDGGVANCTHKSLCLPARGTVMAGGARFDLEGHVGSLDHTSGLLARDTRWRWASACDARTGFNLVAGFNGPVENCVWHEGRLYPVGAAAIDFHGSEWTVRTDDGAVDLAFHAEGERRQDKNLVVAVSRYVQGIGSYRGTLKVGGRAVEIAGLAGVTEDHVAKW
jgi:uncharacterized protein DUF2804